MFSILLWCSNIHKFIDPNTYVKLELEDFEKDFLIIKQAFSETDGRKDYIKKKTSYFKLLPIFPSWNVY